MADRIRPVFLLSLPRSGSTMTQSVLAGHPGIATASEPWILLPLLATLHEDGVDADYDHRWAVRAISSFSEQLPGGADDYRMAIRRFAVDLYASAAGEGARWFVDKTPRYHLVVDDLFEVFPDAVFVFLWRNPLAVATSMMRWYRVGWLPYRHGVDLYDGIANLTAAAQRWRGAGNVVELRYEQLVTDPDTWRPLFDALDTRFDPAVLERLERPAPPGRIGDPMQRYGGVSDRSVHRWQDEVGSSVRVAWLRRYLGWIGEDRLAVMGYDLAELTRQLDEVDGEGWTAAAADLRSAAAQRILAWRSGRDRGPWWPRRERR